MLHSKRVGAPAPQAALRRFLPVSIDQTTESYRDVSNNVTGMIAASSPYYRGKNTT
jgi:hypothetical protein